MWDKEIHRMHDNFGIGEWKENSTPEKRRELMKLRMRMLTEEYAETMDAYLLSDKEEFIDGLIDLCVIAIGTLDIAGVDAGKAWNEVFISNMDKRTGVKPGRSNPLGLPDLIKPFGWTPPDHSKNYGDLDEYL